MVCAFSQKNARLHCNAFFCYYLEYTSFFHKDKKKKDWRENDQSCVCNRYDQLFKEFISLNLIFCPLKGGSF